MTRADFKKIMIRIGQFWPTFSAGRDGEMMIDLWYPLFQNDQAEDVARAVTICICTLKFAPTVADIKQQMAECRLEDQPTAIEAFHVLSEAVKKSCDKAGAAEAFNALPPILRRIAGSSGQMVSWYRLSDESFQTVVMSAIRESYTILAKREAKYYALPAGLQRAENWRIGAPDLEALPEPVKEKTYDEIMSDMAKSAEEYRAKFGIEVNPEYTDRAEKFANPTENELKMIAAKQKRRSDLQLEQLKEAERNGRN